MFNSNVQDALNVHDLREMAKKRLPKWLFEFVDRGTEDELALRNNRAAFERIKLKTRSSSTSPSAIRKSPCSARSTACRWA